MRRHTGIKNFICKTCNKAFGFSSTLIDHLKTHKESTSKKRERTVSSDNLEDQETLAKVPKLEENIFDGLEFDEEQLAVISEFTNDESSNIDS